MAEAPNSWEILNEYSKSIITLAGALLALAATFLTQNLSQQLDVYKIIIIVAASICLFISVLFSLLIIAFVYKSLKMIEDGDSSKKIENEKRVKYVANGAHISFGISFFLILLFIISFIFNGNKTIDLILTDTMGSLSKICKISLDDLEMKAVDYNKDTNIYKFNIVQKSTLKSFTVGVDENSQHIVFIR